MTTPSRWRSTTLGELGRYLNGRGFKKNEWSTSGRPIIRIQNLTGSGEHFNYFAGDVDDRYVVRPGDLLVSWAATLGAYFWHGPEGVLNQHIFKVESNIDPKFHKYLLDHKLGELMQHTHGSGMVHITRGRFDSLPVRVPDFAEQRRIVDLLEDHLSRIEYGLAVVQTAEARLSSLLSSWLQVAMTNDEREIVPLRDALVDIRGGWSRSRAHLVAASDGVPYLKMNNLTRSGRLDLSSLVHVRASDTDKVKFGVRAGDVLFNSKNSGDLVGKTAVADQRVEGAVLNENIMRLRFESRIDPEFAALWFRGSSMRQHILEAASASTNVAAVYQHDLLKFPMWVPDMALQHRLVHDYNAIVDQADLMRTSLAGARQRGSNLRAALLSAAFSGRLTGRECDLDRAEELVEA